MTAKSPPLLSPEFLERLRLLRDLVFRLRRHGEQRGFLSGQAPEFDSHRAYEPGDDPRYIDWNVYARLERLLLKLYTIEDETQVNILVDTSLSMRRPHQAKSDMASRLAAAFAYLTLSGSHHLVLGAFADRLLGTAGPYRSPHHVPQVFNFLSRLPTGEGTKIGSSLSQLIRDYKEPGLLLVISDFFQYGDVLMELDYMRYKRADLYLIHVLDDHEIKPALKGEYDVSDVESLEDLNLYIGYELLENFQRAIAEYVRDIESACRERGIPYLLARSSFDLEDAVINHILAGVKEGR